MVIAIDKHKHPVGFLTERRCRKLMEQKRAVLFRHYPAVAVLKDVDARALQGLHTYRIKIDPGAVHTGIAIVCNETEEAMLYLQIEHRGAQVHKNMDIRKMTRRNRRARETRYRHAKFKNGEYTSSREEGWLPPSVKSIADNIIHWVDELSSWIRITKCSFEAVRFDTQLMDNPDIEGKEYQHGTLAGYEIREYLMEHYRHTCQYCGGKSGDEVLEWEHKIPRSRGGSDRLRNASLACTCCNKDKGALTLEEYLEVLNKRKPRGKSNQDLNKARKENIKKILENGSIIGSSRYSAWANSTRKRIENWLFQKFEDVECSSGGRTKFNRVTLGLPKDHHYDALCIGNVPEGGYKDRTGGYCLYVKAMGRGTRFRGKTNKCGIIIQKLGPRAKRVFGFMNGDIVRAVVPDDARSKYKGVHVGRVMTRAKGYFDIRKSDGSLVTVNYEFCKILQYNNGYSYEYRRAIPLGT